MKNLKYLRIYHHNHFSFKALKEKPFYSFMENLGKYKHTLLEALIITVRDIEPHDKINKSELVSTINDYIMLAETANFIEVPEVYKNKFIAKFCNEYYLKSYIDEFRGDALEYIIFYLEKKSYKKLYHEPDFYNKRKKLPYRKIEGQNCLIDVVERYKSKNYIKLIECKANLDNHTKTLSYKSKFQRKLNFMEAMEKELLQYVDSNNVKLQVEKSLASIITPQRKLPSKYKNYKIIDVYDLFRLNQKII